MCFAFIAFGQAENLAYSIPGRTSVSHSVTVEDLSYDAVKDHSPLIRTGGAQCILYVCDVTLCEEEFDTTEILKNDSDVDHGRKNRFFSFI